MDVAFEWRGGRVWVPILVQGDAAWALFDTGSDGTAIDVQLATRLGLPVKGEEKGSTVAGEVEMVKAGPAEITIGARELSVKEVMLLPLAAQMPGLQAILGFDMLRNVPFTVDYARRHIDLGTVPSGRRFPFILDDDIRPTTWLETLGERFEAHLDTGSSQGVSLPLEWVRTNAPALLKEETQRQILRDVVTSRKFTIDTLRLGGIVLDGVSAEAVSAEKGSFAAQRSCWANVGNEVLKRIRLGIDGRRRESTFELVS